MDNQHEIQVVGKGKTLWTRKLAKARCLPLADWLDMFHSFWSPEHEWIDLSYQANWQGTWMISDYDMDFTLHTALLSFSDVPQIRFSKYLLRYFTVLYQVKRAGRTVWASENAFCTWLSLPTQIRTNIQSYMARTWWVVICSPQLYTTSVRRVSSSGAYRDSREPFFLYVDAIEPFSSLR
jgi:hypothetical protein